MAFRKRHCQLLLQKKGKHTPMLPLSRRESIEMNWLSFPPACELLCVSPTSVVSDGDTGMAGEYFCNADLGLGVRYRLFFRSLRRFLLRRAEFESISWALCVIQYYFREYFVWEFISDQSPTGRDLGRSVLAEDNTDSCLADCRAICEHKLCNPEGKSAQSLTDLSFDYFWPAFVNAWLREANG